ncbi:MAG: pseudouridine synthase [Verrucomicrobia bacterium]|nr:pseudouridine synthase [Verrucomicrobiota bacterium]
MLLVFHKPFGVLSRFTSDGSTHRTLAEFGFPKNVYPLGRLDADSEGLLLLSDEAGLNTRLLDPDAGHARTYWAQVERVPSDASLQQLARGLKIADRTTLNRQVRRMTAAIGHPTLRLIRVSVGRLLLGDLAVGAWRQLSPAERKLVLEG